jgi:hypothetical protein
MSKTFVCISVTGRSFYPLKNDRKPLAHNARLYRSRQVIMKNENVQILQNPYAQTNR